VLEKLGLGRGTKIYKGTGCSFCDNIGYKGRTSLFEVIPISETIRQMILEKTNIEEMKKQSAKENNSTLRESGIKKIKEGITTIDEVLRVTMEVENEDQYE
jgi:type IV pilus assembly protein PilB